MSRIEELERRVRQDPASITFGALAEEYRRAGRLDDAVAACRAGLGRHPSYVSARVTLGRALHELGQPEEARAEFESVLSIAPDNLAAIRGLAEMHGSDAPEPPREPYARVPPPPSPPAPMPVAAPAAVPSPPVTSTVEPALPPAPPADIVSAFDSGEPDFAALDASIAAAVHADVGATPDALTAGAPLAGEADRAPDAQRAAQIERLEIWLVRLDELRRAGSRRA